MTSLYLDKNYGPIESCHPWTVHTAELTRLIRDVRSTKSFAEAWSRLWRGPDTEPPSEPRQA